MKKLNKDYSSINNTVEAYACDCTSVSCPCPCPCSGNATADNSIQNGARSNLASAQQASAVAYLNNH